MQASLVIPALRVGIRRLALCVLALAFGVGGVPVARAAAPADFNGDGYADLAIGAPGEGTGVAQGAGAVTVLYGATALGLQALGAQMLLQETAGPLGISENGDRFGEALAQGDFNGDGRSDLAIGAPGESIGSAQGAGQVTVFYGAPVLGLLAAGAQTFSQETPGVPDASETADHFGAALVAGDFNADRRDDLAIGAPGEGVGVVQKAGQMTVLYGSQRGLRGTDAQLLVPQGPRTGGSYGRVLAANDFNGDGRDDLAAGAVGLGGTGSGSLVTVLPGATGRLSAAAAQTLEAGSPAIAGTGRLADSKPVAMSAADFNGDGSADLAVGDAGTTGAPVGAGKVTVFFGSSDRGLMADGAQAIAQGTGGVPDTADPGDRFGAALAGEDFNRDGRTDLAIGAPGEDVGTSGAAGQVTVLYGTPGRLGTAGATTFSQSPSATHSNSEAGDFFGDALTAGDYDHDGRVDLAVGAPGENTDSSAATGLADAGQVTVLYGTTSGLTTAAAQKFSQNTEWLPDRNEKGDLFGFAFPATRAGVRAGAGAGPAVPAPPPPAPAVPLSSAPAADASPPPAASPMPAVALISAPDQVPPVALSAEAPGAADIAAVSMRRRLRRSEVHRRGLRATLQITPWSGASARVVRVRLLRVLSGGDRRLVRTEYRVTRASGPLRLALAWHTLRPGRYELQAAIGTSRRNLRKPARAGFALVP